MEYIKGVTFAPFCSRGSFQKEEALQSLRHLKERTSANFIILVPNGLQETPQSEQIDFTSMATVGDDELMGMISYAKSIGLRVALKPTVNCKNGTWRAHIHFFEEDVPCEPKWGTWFESYTKFQLHYARIAEITQCEMFLAGCEMVQTEHREKEWRALLKEIRTEFSGLISYNTDKYQEHHVNWWDAVDVISSSGYYPIDDWERQLDRIEVVVKKYQKPFFFAECGCMSTEGSRYVPNNWSVRGNVDLLGQADWYHAMMEAIKIRPFVEGFVIWDWAWHQYSLGDAIKNSGYDVYGKPAEKVINDFFRSVN